MLADVSFLSSVRGVQVRNVHLTQSTLLTEIQKNKLISNHRGYHKIKKTVD